MMIKLNKTVYHIEEGSTLASFIENLGIELQGVAIAVNDEVIPRNQWAETMLADRMELMMIHAISGG